MKKPTNNIGMEDAKIKEGEISSKNIHKVVDFYASTFGNQEALSYPQLNAINDPALHDPFANVDFGRRSKGYTVAGSRADKKIKKKTKTKTISNVEEIKHKVNAGISNLTYYKTDLAIDEFEDALSMLKDQI
mmetsp:Transcript_23947/g.21280  ORF Transcript_23947/g.21280 Transcript_23947/m.21280 type:complete len:132 (+) Transcript_23947:669-1064(+)